MLKISSEHAKILNLMKAGWVLHTSSGCFHSEIWLEKNGARNTDFDRKSASDIIKSNKVRHHPTPRTSTTFEDSYTIK